MVSDMRINRRGFLKAVAVTATGVSGFGYLEKRDYDKAKEAFELEEGSLGDFLSFVINKDSWRERRNEKYFWKKYPTVEVEMIDGSVETFHYTRDKDYPWKFWFYDENGNKDTDARIKFGLKIKYPIQLNEGDKYPMGVFNNTIESIADEIANHRTYKDAVELIEKSPEDYEFFKYWVEEVIISENVPMMGSLNNGKIEININYLDNAETDLIAQNLMHKTQHIYDNNNIYYKKFYNNTFTCEDAEEQERRAIERQEYFLVRIRRLSLEEAEKQIEDAMKTRWWESGTPFGEECKEKRIHPLGS